MYYLRDGPERAFVSEELMLIPEDTELPPDYVQTLQYLSRSRPLPIGKNKKVIGLMKDELGGEIMKEFVSLRPKMYSYKVGNSEPKKCKGIKKCIVKCTISFDDYKRCLFGGEQCHRSQLLFRSCKHKVKTLEVNKLALSREDDKRISIDGVASCTIGHYRVPIWLKNKTNLIIPI